MNQRIMHRGPDDGAEYYEQAKGIGLAHRRLSIIDLSPLGQQPFWDVTGQVCITYNGEIYNYRELRKSLVDDGFDFKSQTDTEVLVNMYLRDGPDMLAKLNGIYAFAIWDAKTQDLFLARDGLGVKPLYYALTSKGFIFSSEMKALLEEPSVSTELDLEAIHYYLSYLWCPSPSTILSAVKKLEPGHALIVRAGKIVKSWQFYDLPYDSPITPMSEAEAIDGLRDVLSQAVDRQMVADVPVGAFLSGGLDSSAVVSYANEYSSDPLACFTIKLKGTEQQDGFADDLPYAHKVAKHLGTELHTIEVGAEMADDLEKMIYFLDEPQADPAPLNAYYICQHAKDMGYKVLLSGAGGDDIFSGYRRHYALILEQYWSWLPKWMRHGLSSMSGMLPKNNPAARRFSKAFTYAHLPELNRLVSYFYWCNENKLKTMYGQRFSDQLTSLNVAGPLMSSLNSVKDNQSKLNQMLYLEAKHFLCDHNLNYTDKMAMATGVEVRVPLLDTDLIKYATQLPPKYKQRGREGKWILKKAMEGRLPHDVIYRPKTGFGAPVREWLQGPLKSFAEDVLSESALSQRGLFDHKMVQTMMKDTASGKEDGSYTLLSMICIELWCQLFLDKRSRW